MNGQDHQGAEDVSTTLPEWKFNIAVCNFIIVGKELPASISGI
jgi:hypothetical protein